MKILSHEKDVSKSLAKIKGLTLAECLTFFYDKATKRDQKIAAMCEHDDCDFEVDGAVVSEGDDNGAYVMGWRWVDFAGTEFDKETDSVW